MTTASRLLMGAAARLLSARHGAWAQAMQAEAKAIEDEREALAFAWGCLCTALGHAFASARAGLGQVHHFGVLACSATVLLGCVYMHRAGAPSHYVWINLLSLAFALVTFRLLPLQRLQADELLRAKASFAMGAALLVLSSGPMFTGAVAWLRLGSLPLNLAWLLLPPLLVAADVRRLPAARGWALGGLLMACLALALMADVALMGLAAVVLSVLAWRDRSTALALLAWVTAVMALHVGQRWQTPEALDFVDRVLIGGMDRSLAIGLALALLQLLPLGPALRYRGAHIHGLVWGLLVALSLPGWLPSPLVGFGGSFICAYVLSLALMSEGSAERPAARRWHVSLRRRRHPPPLPHSSLT
ncbi:hypothetical protein ACG02S_00095 [Roseateles sp. DC23W]|uniref:Uncharacterized protein n=1 Tax=Pelomonas dachongensis TaxID=3299029 RepID=A0ABW7EFQ0_9BURK